MKNLANVRLTWCLLGFLTGVGVTIATTRHDCGVKIASGVTGATMSGAVIGGHAHAVCIND